MNYILVVKIFYYFDNIVENDQGFSLLQLLLSETRG